MAENFEEDDDLRRLKSWWRENGLALVLGAGVGLAAILGWQWWQAHQESNAMQASGLYTQLRGALAQGNAGEETMALAQRLKNEFTGTPYATQAGLALARFHVEREDYNSALEQLEWVVNYADQGPMRHIARVRQARLLWAQNQSDKALELLDHEHDPAFTPLYAELVGDIHAEAGEQDAARAAYREALKNLPLDSDRAAIERKLQDVGGQLEAGPEETAS